MPKDKPISSLIGDVRGLTSKPPLPKRVAPSVPEAGLPLNASFRLDNSVTAEPLFQAGLSLRELREAREWEPGRDVMSGSQVNQKITDTYTAIDQAMTRYLGEPRRPNWATFGKFASRNAGDQIIRLEAIEKAARLDVNSGVSLVREFFRRPGQGLEQAWAMMGGEKNPKAFIENAKKLRQALVRGNTGIIEEIAPAYRIFLQAEGDGKNGVDALRQAGYGRPPKDTQAFMIQAFQRYREVNQMDAEIQSLKQKAGIDDLEAPDLNVANSQKSYRVHAMARQAGLDAHPTLALGKLLEERNYKLLEANLYLGLQEQFMTLQSADVFEDSEVSRLMKRLSGSMAIRDATETVRLLPDGGNWANFLDRMGLKEASENDREVAKISGFHPFSVEIDGKTRHLIPAHRPGTIAEYFLDTSKDAQKALEMLWRTPEPLKF